MILGNINSLLEECKETDVLPASSTDLTEVMRRAKMSVSVRFSISI